MIKRKRSIIEIICSEGATICGAKAVVALQCKMTMKPNQFKELIKKSNPISNGKKGLRQRALSLLQKAGLPNNRELTIEEIAAFEKHVESKIYVLTLDSSDIDKPSVIPCSNETGFEREMFLYLASNHFHAVSNVSAMCPNHILCKKCYQFYHLKSKHECNDHPPCHACKRTVCVPDVSIFCENCNVTFRSNECYDVHLGQRGKNPAHANLCDSRKKCLKCLKFVYMKEQKLEDHVCGTFKCPNCKEFKERSHLCYLRRKQMKVSSSLLKFCDFEYLKYV